MTKSTITSAPGTPTPPSPSPEIRRETLSAEHLGASLTQLLVSVLHNRAEAIHPIEYRRYRWPLLDGIRFQAWLTADNCALLVIHNSPSASMMIGNGTLQEEAARLFPPPELSRFRKWHEALRTQFAVDDGGAVYLVPIRAVSDDFQVVWTSWVDSDRVLLSLQADLNLEHHQRFLGLDHEPIFPEPPTPETARPGTVPQVSPPTIVERVPEIVPERAEPLFQFTRPDGGSAIVSREGMKWRVTLTGWRAVLNPMTPGHLWIILLAGCIDPRARKTKPIPKCALFDPDPEMFPNTGIPGVAFERVRPDQASQYLKRTKAGRYRGFLRHVVQIESQVPGGYPSFVAFLDPQQNNWLETQGRALRRDRQRGTSKEEARAHDSSPSRRRSSRRPRRAT